MRAHPLSRWPSALALTLSAACSHPAPPVDSGDATADAVSLDTGAHTCTRALGIERVEDLGAFSLPSRTVISRDGTSSARIGDRLVWTFGDTFLAAHNPVDQSSVLSATAGWSTPESPLALQEPVDDAGFPNQLIPYTADELAANQRDALNGWALWPGAVIDTGGPNALVLFQRIKRTNGSGFDAMGVGTARLAPGETHAQRDPADLFPAPLDAGVSDASAPPSLYGAAGVTVLDGYAFFYACSTIGFLNTGCRVARAPVSHADDRSAFEFFDGHGWNADLHSAAVVIEQVGGGLSISFNPYLGCYLAVTGGVLRSAFTLRTSTRLESGWGRVEEGVTIDAGPDSGVMEPASGAYDYLFLEHPELRSADGRQIVISYAQPLANFRGNVRLARITLR